MTLRHGQSADFFLDGQKLPMDFFIKGRRPGVGDLVLVAVDVATPHVVWARSYPTDLEDHDGRLAMKVASDLAALPAGFAVLAAYQTTRRGGAGCWSLEALRQFGAKPPDRGSFRPCYAFIGVKGYGAIAEYAGQSVAIQGRLPRIINPTDAGHHLCGEQASVRSVDGWRETIDPKMASQQHELDRQRARIKELETTVSRLQREAADTAQERDFWKGRAARAQLNEEFKSLLNNTTRQQDNKKQEDASGGGARKTPMPRSTSDFTSSDFGQVLRQQLRLLEDS